MSSQSGTRISDFETSERVNVSGGSVLPRRAVSCREEPKGVDGRNNTGLPGVVCCLVPRTHTYPRTRTRTRTHAIRLSVINIGTAGFIRVTRFHPPVFISNF